MSGGGGRRRAGGGGGGGGGGGLLVVAAIATLMKPLLNFCRNSVATLAAKTTASGCVAIDVENRRFDHLGDVGKGRARTANNAGWW